MSAWGTGYLSCKNRDNGRIFVKKYVAASVIPVYEKLIAIRNEHLENIYDFAAGEERGILITGYISGISVQQYLEYYGVFAEERVKDYMADILEVLGQVHALGIVHRDITAGNIMISDDGIVKLIDFGIAREVKKNREKIPWYLEPLDMQHLNNLDFTSRMQGQTYML